MDEVRLTGTFNSDLERDGRAASWCAKPWRVLKPGGKVVTHGLMGDGPLTGKANLPGLAALVSRVPAQGEPLELFKNGRPRWRCKWSNTPEQAWFVHDGVEMREVKLIASETGSRRQGRRRPIKCFTRDRFARRRRGAAAGSFRAAGATSVAVTV